MPTTQKKRSSTTRKISSQNVRRKPVRRRSRRSRSGFRPSQLLLAAVFFLLIIGLGGNLFGSSGDKTDYSISNSSLSSETMRAIPLTAATDETSATLSPELPTEESAAAPPTAAPTLEPTAEPAPTATAAPVQTDPTEHTIQAGDKGDDVLALQRYLANLGYLSSGDADGIYGNKTKNALIEYQKAAGLPATGICDYNTYLSLTSGNAPAKKQQPSANSGSGSGPTVYVTRTGEKYHYYGCQYIKGKSDLRKMTKSEAISRGYTACSKCG